MKNILFLILLITGIALAQTAPPPEDDPTGERYDKLALYKNTGCSGTPELIAKESTVYLHMDIYGWQGHSWGWWDNDEGRMAGSCISATGVPGQEASETQ